MPELLPGVGIGILGQETKREQQPALRPELFAAADCIRGSWLPSSLPMLPVARFLMVSRPPDFVSLSPEGPPSDENLGARLLGLCGTAHVNSHLPLSIAIYGIE